MSECGPTPTADDIGKTAQIAAEAHLRACWEALSSEEDGDDNPAWPETAGPFCGCDTCVIRETLEAAWPLLVEAVRAEVALDVQRIALRPGDTVLINSGVSLTMEQIHLILARVKDVFPDHRAIVMDNALTMSVVSTEDEDGVPVPAVTE